MGCGDLRIQFALFLSFILGNVFSVSLASIPIPNPSFLSLSLTHSLSMVWILLPFPASFVCFYFVWEFEHKIIRKEFRCAVYMIWV